jgi:hypothetical protein
MKLIEMCKIKKLQDGISGGRVVYTSRRTESAGNTPDFGRILAGNGRNRRVAGEDEAGGANENEGERSAVNAGEMVGVVGTPWCGVSEPHGAACPDPRWFHPGAM